MRSKERMGYFHKLHFFDPCNNIIIIIMVINNFNTTLYIGYIQGETDVSFRVFSLNVNPPLGGKAYIPK